MFFDKNIIFNKKYLLIIPKDKSSYIKYFNYTFKNVFIYDYENDPDSLNNIKYNNFTEIIFVDFLPYYEEFITNNGQDFTIKFIITEPLGAFSDNGKYSTFKNIMRLFDNNIIKSLGVIDKNLYEVLSVKHKNIYKIDLDIPKNKGITKNFGQTIGILSNQGDPKHSFYNALSAIKLNNHIAKIMKPNKETKNFAKLFKIKILSCNNYSDLIKNNLVNVYVNFTNNNNCLFYESMDQGIPCIIGNNDLELNEYLKNNLVVKSDDSVDEIAEKIENALKNRKKIIEEYNKIRDNYTKNVIEKLEKFLECKIETEVHNDYKKILSIIVPIYNTEKYLDGCLKSIIKALPNKFRINTEILLINDGSTDNSSKIAMKYEKKYPKLIKYYNQKNRGLGNVRNFGLKVSQGKYISSIDSDDIIHKNFYKEFFATLDENVDIIICDWLSITTNSKFDTAALDTLLPFDSKYKKILYATIMPSACNKIVKKSLYNNIKFIENKKYEDLSANPIIMLKAQTIKYVNKSYYGYMLSPGSIMRSNAGIDMIDILKILDDRIKKASLLNSTSHIEFINYVYWWRLEELFFNQLYNLDKKELKSFIDHYYANIKEISDLLFKNNEFVNDIINLFDEGTKEYIFKRNKAIINNQLYEFIINAINNNNYKIITAAMILYNIDNRKK